MKLNSFATLVIFTIIVCISCKEPNKKQEVTESKDTQTSQDIVKSVLTLEEQNAMTAEQILDKLKEGNENFVNNTLTQRDHSEQRRKAVIGQYPKAIVLSCVDSRVPVEDVFDLGIGDIFVARVAGNIENSDIIGSMEFATAVAGSKVIIIMGHTACGAVKHAIDNTDAKSMGMTSLQNLLNEIKPAVHAKKGEELSSKNKTLTNRIITNNVRKTVGDILAKSPEIAKLEKENTLKIVGAVYNMETGIVKFLE